MNMIPYILENPEYIGCCILLILLIVYMIVRFPKYRTSGFHYNRNNQAESDEKPISVVVVSRNQGYYLEQLLTSLCEQDYKNFEVIVVDDASVDDTSDIIKRMEHEHNFIRHTFIPNTARYVSRSKLAITLGIRAARNEWIILTEGDCCPTSKQWLKTIAAHCSEDYDFVCGNTRFLHNGSLYHKRLSLNRTVRNLRQFHAAAAHKKSKAIGGDYCNLALRKSLFMKHKGFSEDLNLLGGEELSFTDMAAKAGRTCVVTLPEATMTQQTPNTSESWDIYRLTQTEAERHLSIRAHFNRLMWGLSSTILYIIWIMLIVCSILFVLKEEYTLMAFPICIAFIVFLLDECLFNRATYRLNGCRYVFLWPCYNLTQPLFNVVYKIKSKHQRRDLMRGL